MKIKVVLLLIISSIFTSGCSLKTPMTANEFKTKWPDSLTGKVDTYTANKSLKSITRIFNQRTKACFKKTVNRSLCLKGAGVNSRADSTQTYTPRLKKTKNKLQLTIQKKRKGENVIMGQAIPKDGYYVFMTEIMYANRKSSKVKTYYGQHAGTEKFAKAVKNWVSGKSKGCPDITY